MGKPERARERERNRVNRARWEWSPREAARHGREPRRGEGEQCTTVGLSRESSANHPSTCERQAKSCLGSPIISQSLRDLVLDYQTKQNPGEFGWPNSRETIIE